MRNRCGRIAVTGVAGFVGRHVVTTALAAGLEVVGIALQPIEDEELHSQLAVEITHDLTRGWPDVGDVDAVIHLAGLSAVGPSFASPQAYIETNSAMVTHLGEATLSNKGHRPRIIGISSGAVYAEGSGGALSEGDAVTATSPYAVSKLLVENQYTYYAARGLDVVAVRPFNHIGPGQSPGFLLPDLVASLEQLPRGGTLEVGNLGSARDYTDVRDVAAAYVELAVTDRPLMPLYNIASGRSLKGLEILELAAEALGVPVPPTRTDPSRLRATDASRVVGDARRLASGLGWRPQIQIRDSVGDYVRGERASR
ncbi:NAD-dependent epimerase/dehydratase family protein [Tessaracoccus sp.]